MFYLDEQLNRYYVGKAFTYGGIQYTRAGATHETFVELGFTPVEIQARPDDRFYIVGAVNDDGSYQSEWRDLADLKETFIQELQQRALSLLERTNWYIIRQVETGVGAPPEVDSFRDSVRSAWEARLASIQGAASQQALKALIESPDGFPVEEV